GPKRSNPLGGPRSPLKISGLNIGQITDSITDSLAAFKPAMPSHFTLTSFNMISLQIISTRDGSKFLNFSGTSLVTGQEVVIAYPLGNNSLRSFAFPSPTFIFFSAGSSSFFLNGGVNFRFTPLLGALFVVNAPLAL